MKTQQLGEQGLVVSAMGLGCMGMSDAYGRPTRPSRSRLFIDSRWTWASISSIRRHVRPVQQRAARRQGDPRAGATRWSSPRSSPTCAARRQAGGINGCPEYVRGRAAMSAEAPRRGHIDLYYQHRVDPEVPIEETVGAMAELVKGQGEVPRAFRGGREDHPPRPCRAPITALQTEYSLWTRDAEGEILDTCRELGISFVAYSPLGRGFLTGRFLAASRIWHRTIGAATGHGSRERTSRRTWSSWNE